MNHTRSLAHASHGHRGFSQLKPDSHLLVLCIRSHNGPGCACAALKASVQQRSHSLDPCRNPVHGQLHADDACGCHQDAFSRNSQGQGRCLCCLSAVPHAFLSGAGIGNACVYNHCPGRRPACHLVLIPFYRSCLHNIGGEGSCRPAGLLAVNHSHVLTVLIFDSGCC